MTEIMRASREWYSRPDDERFVSLYELRDHVQKRKLHSEVEIINVNHLEATGKRQYSDEQHYADDLSLSVKTSMHGWEQLTPTHWSFGQLCTKAQAPASYMRKLHPELASFNLNYGMQVLAPKEDAKLMVVRDNEAATQELHCLTGKDYGRIWDEQVVEQVIAMNEGAGNVWKVPSASYMVKDPRRATTLYASDRDVFVFLVNENSGCEITDKWGKTHNMNKFIIVWNSEVGKTTLGATFGNYDFICDNRIIWGASNVRELRVRHSKFAPDRFATEMTPMLNQYAQLSADADARIYKAAMEIEVAKDEQGIKTWLRGKGFNTSEQQRILRQGISDRGGELPSTVWELVSAGTAAARAIPHTDARVSFEKRASSLLDVAERKSEYVAAA